MAVQLAAWSYIFSVTSGLLGSPSKLRLMSKQYQMRQVSRSSASDSVGSEGLMLGVIVAVHNLVAVD